MGRCPTAILSAFLFLVGALPPAKARSLSGEICNLTIRLFLPLDGLEDLGVGEGFEPVFLSLILGAGWTGVDFDTGGAGLAVGAGF